MTLVLPPFNIVTFLHDLPFSSFLLLCFAQDVVRRLKIFVVNVPMPFLSNYKDDRRFCPHDFPVQQFASLCEHGGQPTNRQLMDVP